MVKIDLVQVKVPLVSEELKAAPLGVAVSVLMKDEPKNAELVGVIKEGKASFEIREKTWIEQYA